MMNLYQVCKTMCENLFDNYETPICETTIVFDDSEITVDEEREEACTNDADSLVGNVALVIVLVVFVLFILGD